MSPEATVSIGRVEGDSAYLFHRVVSAHFTGDGRIVVADQGLAVVRVYDAEGRFLVQLGGRGDGPGEFSNSLRSMWVTPPDTLGVWDSGNSRVTYFTTDGGLVRTATVSPSIDAPRAGRLDIFVAQFSDGSVALSRIAGGPRSPGGPSPDRLTVERFGPGGNFRNTVAELAGFIRNGGSPIPFSPYPWFAEYRDSVYFTNGLLPEVRTWDRDGVAGRTIELPPAGVDVSKAWADLKAAVEARGSELQREQLSSMPHPDSLPNLAGLLVDGAGRVWTKRYDPATDALWLHGGASIQGGTWWVVDRDGSVLATATVPEGLIPMQVQGDRVLALSADSLGVERVTVHHLSAPTKASPS